MGDVMTDAERIKEITKLQAELNAEEAAHAAKVLSIREQINALCGLSCGRQRKEKGMSSDTFVVLGMRTGGRRERVA